MSDTLKNITSRLTASSRITAATPQWQSAVIKALSVVRKPKVVRQSDAELEVLVGGTFSFYPTTLQLLAREGVSVSASPESSSMSRIIFKKLG